MIGRLLDRLPPVPLPEIHGIYWAARRPRVSPARVELLAAGAALLEAIALFGIALLAWLAPRGPVPLAACLALWLLAGLGDWAITRHDSKIARMTSYVGVQANLRALLRAAFALAALANLGNGADALAYLVVVVAVQLGWGFLGTLARWLFGLQAPLAYDAGSGRQGAGFRKYAQIYVTAVGTPPALLAAEAFVLAGSLVGQLAPGVVTALLTLAGYTMLTTNRFRRVRGSVPADSQALADQVAGRQPKYVFYVDSSVGMSKYVCNQWLPVFDLATVPGFVMVRQASELPILLATSLPIVYAPGPRQVEKLTVPSVRAAFYAGFGLKNAQLMRNPALHHVMLNHGDSDKASSFNATAAAYDELWVAGEAAVERYRSAGIHLEPNRYALIGRPQVEALRVGPLGQDPSVVLYAPTWEGYFDETDYTSLDSLGPELLAWLLKQHPEVRVWFKPHPSSGRLRVSMLAARNELNGLLRQAGPGNLLVDEQGMTLAEAMNSADVLVTDVSSVASDFLATRRPLVVCNPGGLGEAEFNSQYPSLTAAYRLDPGLRNASEVFDQALGDDRLAGARQAAAAYILGDHPLGPQHTFNTALARITA